MVDFVFKTSDLEFIRDNPHKLGHLMGKTLLTPLHSKWIKDVWIKKLPLLAHRGSYKTTAVVEVGSVWWHLFHPNDRIGIFRKPYTEAANSVRVIKEFYSQEAVRALFKFAHGIYPAFKQNKEGNIIFNFKRTNTKEGSLNAYASNHPRTGTHLDEALIDDFVTLDDRISRAERNQTDNGLREIITNIMDPGQVPGFLGTPWHKEDGWRLVPGDIQRYDIYATGLLTPEQIAYKKSTTTASLYACNYLLEHIANVDNIFQDPIYGEWDKSIPIVYAHLDAKYSGNHTNGLTIMAKRPDGRIQAAGFTSTEHVDEWQEFIKLKYLQYHVKRLYNETNADKGYLVKELKAKTMNIYPYCESMNKHIKIETYLKKYWNQILWAPETQPEYLVQITDYMEGQEPDDCPDSAASLLREAIYPSGANALYEL
jgi:hypothetical protein